MIKKIASIRGNDDPDWEEIIIMVDADEEDMQLIASNGEEMDHINVKTYEQLFNAIYILWGSWNTFEWLAEYTDCEIYEMEIEKGDD